MLKMTFFRIYRLLSPLVMFAALAACSKTEPNYREIWQSEHHLTDEQMFEAYGGLNEDTDKMMGLVIEGQNGNWEKIKQMTEKEVASEVYAYYHNLANAMTGCLSDSLMYYYQPFERGLFLPVNENSGQFKIAASSEVWFRLGEMTMAEHSTILAQISTINHFGVPYLKRLAEINLVNNDNTAAIKYLNLLEKEPGLEKWVKDRRPGSQSQEVKSYLAHLHSLSPSIDIVHTASNHHAALKNLLASNPDNELALEYLLCYDLLSKEIGYFMQDLSPKAKHNRLYQEAVLIYLAFNNMLDANHIKSYAIDEDILSDFIEYSNLYGESGGSIKSVSKFRRTYWYYFHFATRNENKN